MGAELDTPTSKEVLVLDSCTFIGEAGLTSRKGSALRHYLHARGTQLAVPPAVVEECERHLRERVVGKIKSVQAGLGWLSRFCGGVNGWTAPEDVEITERVQAVSHGEAFDAVVLAETPALRRLAEERHRVQRPPSHSRDSLCDCVIWEHCLELLKSHDVIFVSDDTDFRGYGNPEKLHPQLRAEADAMAEGSLTFHRGMASLMSDMSAEVRHVPDEKVFAFVYAAVREEALELEANSGGWRPTATGTVEQQMFTTDEAGLVEVRLRVTDEWRRIGSEDTLEFRLSGSCQYGLSESELSELSVTRLGLYVKQAGGTVRAVEGSYVNLSAHFHGGTPPLRSEPVSIGGQA